MYRQLSQKVLGLLFGAALLFVAAPAMAVTSQPDLTAVKTNSLGASHALVGTPFNWKITVTNSGNKDTTPGNGVVLLRDELPTSGATYGAPSVVSVSHVDNSNHISCSITSNVLTCATTHGDVKMKDPDGTFGVQFSVTPTASGTLTNPKSGGVCKADPDGDISESNESNNTCSNSVIVDPVLATLTINKVVVPSDDSGKFNLQIDGSTAGTGANVGNGGTTGG